MFNELAMIFGRMDIRSSDVFEASATKWNFHRYRPGLVGGHCIPVDPYYLMYSATQHGYVPNVILSGRSANEFMPEFIADKAGKLLEGRGKNPRSSTVLVLGATFKKDIVDQRNSKALVLAKLLASQLESVHVHDPLVWVDENEIQGSNYAMVGDPLESGIKYDLVVVTVAHSAFAAIANRLDDLAVDDGVIMDLTGEFVRVPGESDLRSYWRL